MELVTFAREIAQNVAEYAASYRFGQTVLRQLDRALWVVEKCARWAVPPPLDQDERPQPTLIRPLPWVFFLAMLVTLRVTRESISVVNLLLGKPPLRSADVVIYIQSKRRYLRTLKYQGNRKFRARTSTAHTREPWYTRIQSLFEFTMCFRRSYNYGNNNTTRVSNNDEVLVVKRSKRPREPTSPVASTSTGETTMERLIEKMMVDLDAESDDDSSFTLTNVTGVRSDRSDSESEQETVKSHDDTLTSTQANEITQDTDNAETNASKDYVVNSENDTEHLQKESPPKSKEVVTSTPEKNDAPNAHMSTDETQTPIKDKSELSEVNDVQANCEENKLQEDAALEPPKTPKKHSPKEESVKFIQSERCSPQKSPQSPKNTKLGRKISVALSKFLNPKSERIESIGLQTQRSPDTPGVTSGEAK